VRTPRLPTCIECSARNRGLSILFVHDVIGQGDREHQSFRAQAKKKKSRCPSVSIRLDELRSWGFHLTSPSLAGASPITLIQTLPLSPPMARAAAAGFLVRPDGSSWSSSFQILNYFPFGIEPILPLL